MRPISLPHRGFSLLLPAVLAACSNATSLPPAQFENVVDTTTLYALTGTPIGTPSGFDGVSAAPVRTDLNAPFDFAVDLDANENLLLFPAGALGIRTGAAIAVSDETFDGLASAPREGFEADSAVVLATGALFVLRSRSSSQQCSLGGSLPRYGKFRVLAVDRAQRSVTFEFLVNLNCGYRDLVPGIPDA